VLELDPLYCDTIIRRWQNLTGKFVELAETGEHFDDLEERRHSDPAAAGTASNEDDNSDPDKELAHE